MKRIVMSQRVSFYHVVLSLFLATNGISSRGILPFADAFCAPSTHQRRLLGTVTPTRWQPLLPFCTYAASSSTTRRLVQPNDSVEPISSEAPQNKKASLLLLSRQVQAGLLIAGTTVGGGFLALPTSVVVPVGGFVPAAIRLTVVWMYLVVQSLVLCTCLVHVHDAQRDDSSTDARIGIPRVAQAALGTRGAATASVLLTVLTQATLVSQLSRAGSLWADTTAFSDSSSSMLSYRVGCSLAALVGAIFSFGGNKRNSTNNNVTNDNDSTETRSLATTVNAILTAIFLFFVILLFQAGQEQAIWSRCLPTTALASISLGPIAKATPIMLQLLVYGEILPNVCHMLSYDMGRIRASVIVGSLIPLGLLTGWAALGVALVPPALAQMADPVNVLLQGGGTSIARRLLVLSASAIGTTILGSFLALESAYHDVVSMVSSSSRQKQQQQSTADDSNPVPQTNSSFWQQGWVSNLVITLPPLLIASISPSIFLQAIDFAGSYPILLLYGIMPPLIALKLRVSTRATMKWKHVLLVGMSGAMVSANFATDLWAAWNSVVAAIASVHS